MYVILGRPVLSLYCTNHEYECVSLETGLNIATYNRAWFHLFNSKSSTLDIVAGADADLTDALVGEKPSF